MSLIADNPERLVAALLAAGMVSLLARRVRTLSTSGAIAATIVGSLIVAGAGWWCGAILILYFVTSSAFSTFRTDRSNQVRQERGSQRDAIQVLANGGIPALFAGVAWATDSSIWTLGAVCAIAAATADTWATEVGRLTGATPRSIVGWRAVSAGTSGAISLPGTFASVAGSLAIATCSAIGTGQGWLDTGIGSLPTLALCTVAGSAGSLLDSVLGSTIQEMFRCERCGQTSETAVHSCGSPARRVSGVAGVDNDIVNLIGILVPALGTILIVGLSS